MIATRGMWDLARPHDRRERLFGGRGAVVVWNLGAAAPSPPFGAILACELEAGGSVGRHVQAELSEIVIVLEGDGVATVDGAPAPIGPGSVVELPLGKTLALENGSATQPLRYLIVKASV
jgi:uncharacterized cupin superfamily protein